MTPDPSDDLDPRGPTRPRGHTLQDRIRRSAEQRVQHQARAHPPTGQGDELAALLDLLENGPAVPPVAPGDGPPPAAATPPAAAPPAPAVPPPPPPPAAAAPPVVPPPAAPVPPPTPPVARRDGTFTRETFTRETFTPHPNVEDGSVLDVPSHDTWDVAGVAPTAPVDHGRGALAPGPALPPEPEPESVPAAAPEARHHDAPGLPAPVPLPAPRPEPSPPGVHEPDELDEATPADEPGQGLVVAPLRVPEVDARPAGLRARRRMSRDLRQAKRERRMTQRRYRIFPRTVIGITAMLLVAAIAAGASGAVLYAYYDWRLTQNEDRVGDLAEGLETRLEDANVAVENATNEAVADVRAEGDALRQLIDDQNQIADLRPQISESVWYVSTLDDTGQASVGSAFVVAGDADGSLLLTSYAAVSASTVDPAPEITLRKGDRTMVATLYAWDPARDLALLTVDTPDMAPLVWANEEDRAEAAGKRGFAVTGLGGADATFSPGTVLDLTATGIQHNVAISEQFQGGPLLNADGKVLGVASMEYNPLNFESTGSVSFATPVGLACEQVLTCNGDASAPG